jgi:hypothetical protein
VIVLTPREESAGGMGVWSEQPTHEPIVTRDMSDAAAAVAKTEQRSRDGGGPNTEHPDTKRSYFLRSFCHLSCLRTPDARQDTPPNPLLRVPSGAKPEARGRARFSNRREEKWNQESLDGTMQYPVPLTLITASVTKFTGRFGPRGPRPNSVTRIPYSWRVVGT